MKINIYLSASSLAPIKANPYVYLFLKVTIDFITDLLESNRYNTLYIVVDYDLIKVIVLILYIKTIDALNIVELYYNNIYWRFELVNKIISDQKLQFLSQVF